MKTGYRSRPRAAHYGILVNRKAACYDRLAVSRLIAVIRQKNGFYTVVEPDSAMGLLHKAKIMAGTRRTSRHRTPEEHRRGKVTSLVACGGDGTFNLVARAAVEAGLPLGLLPMGKENNIGMGLFDSIKPEKCISRIVSPKYKAIDYATVSNQMFFGSAALGLIPNLKILLAQNGKPRFGIGWSKLGAKAAANCNVRNTIIKVDAFRFEVSPLILNINLLPYSAGIKISPVSGISDGLAEVIFDVNIRPKETGRIIRQLMNGKFVYGTSVRLFRGKIITVQPTSGMTMYLDGELLKLPTNLIEIEVGSKPLRVAC